MTGRPLFRVLNFHSEVIHLPEIYTMKELGLIFLLSLSILAPGQGQTGEMINTSSRMLADPDKLTIGGYGQIDFNQPIANGKFSNGTMDVHRLVMMFGYKFNERTSFITEIEFEHVKEVYIEQAFVDHEILSWLHLRGGLMLIPMGIINEYHEPTTFNGVERPNLDKYIIPTTWREIGLGLTGQFPASGIGYQLYLVNGLLGSDNGDPKLSGSSLFRSGRQKGAESVFTSPNITFRVSYTGIPGLNAGFSGYFGDTQSTLFDGIDRSDPGMLAVADSSVVGIRMIGLDARYHIHGFGLRGQLVTGSIANAQAYNAFHGSDLGSSFLGYYAEISYDLFHTADFLEHQLIPFFRYERYDTHRTVDASISRAPSFNRQDLTFGLGWKPNNGVIFKADFQIYSDESGSDSKHQLNAGIGIWF